MLRETSSRGRCELVCPSRTNERGGEGYCVKEGGGEEGERERERAGEVCVFYYCRTYYKAGRCVCFITAGPITKLCAWGEEESGGHVL